METKTLKIEVPEGYEIDKDNSTFENIVFKKIEPKFSNNWEEFCKNNLKVENESYIGTYSHIRQGKTIYERHIDEDRNLMPSKFVEPMLALIQLLTIREKEYTKGWEPDWNNSAPKYFICVLNDKARGDSCYYTNQSLTFPTKELRDTFINNWKDLIEVAKPLL